MLRRLPFLLFLISCNGQNGLDGVTGADGAPGFVGHDHSTISIITPCGANTSPNKEVLLCLESGQVLADFSQNGSALFTRLTIITTGAYRDTDNSNCPFEASVDYLGNTKISWNAGKNSYASWPSGAVICGAE